MSRMFSDQAEFGKMLQSPEPLKVSAIIHKAFIEVNEEGTEAAAATGKWSKSLVFFGIHHPVHVPFVHPCVSCLLPILQAWRCVGSALLCRLRNQLSSLPTILSPMSLCIRRICHCFGAQLCGSRKIPSPPASMMSCDGTWFFGKTIKTAIYLQWKLSNCLKLWDNPFIGIPGWHTLRQINCICSITSLATY